ncbi:tyrosine-protein phosphatase [Tetragenococcus koreensis]|uniref:Tyrosine-protein phosphatase n=1 Tax=Tetragenococcus koreensis TaxID=290335 RepID=A0AAN4RL10_9ENTE|nr:CpsB/CapC family capsule biosynthesis tyrosine phosphatase [Tetragenococcus koreensis]GEQ49552.1 exopolysaccharide biosynthesis protein [Tetragenococcus koreensis]GEQ51998.1 exopolysaccharide biosynthesis protein [Tetragenococcus koreensis]GEQ54533.1 exopolysaccharide biosynthesis protein [Tetragenococcus koreensis]GEQ57000.1 exopolysaccharide biosynthesis protein [Tetragenococcus koreensis]GEQ59565.1 exopolysaccharide biosynthesis protein [Tetragenococcus koreensis]
MIDLHCHILPNIDDGSDSIETSLAMAKKAIEQGITHILCTPHHNNGRYQNPKATVITTVALLQDELDRRQYNLTLLEGQEIRITGELLQEMDNDRILFTDLANTYLLLELPTMDIPAYTDQLFFELRARGKVPVIVHPERNAKFRESPNRLIPYLEMGCLAQLTAPSLVGSFGKSIQKTAKEMVKHNLVQMIASDAHGINQRTFYLKEAYEQVGKKRAQLMQQVAKDLVNGDQVTYPKYKEVKKKRFGLF